MGNSVSTPYGLMSKANKRISKKISKLTKQLDGGGKSNGDSNRYEKKDFMLNGVCSAFIKICDKEGISTIFILYRF
jgi:hypothetical protein